MLVGSDLLLNLAVYSIVILRAVSLRVVKGCVSWRGIYKDQSILYISLTTSKEISKAGVVNFILQSVESCLIVFYTRPPFSHRQSFSSPLVLRLLAQLVKLFCMPTDISSGCGLQGSKADHTKLLESLYERVWSHSKFLPVMCLSHDYEDKECADSDQNELKGD